MTAPPLPDLVTSDRLRLVLISPEDAEGMLAGKRRTSWHVDYPCREDQDAVVLVKAGDPQATWGPRHVTRAFDGLVVGRIGFFGAPAPFEAGSTEGSAEDPTDGSADVVEEVEVGFGLVEDARHRGVAAEALTALLRETDRAGVRVRAHVRPENRAGLKVLATCGFTGLRGTTQEGDLVMVRPLPA